MREPDLAKGMVDAWRLRLPEMKMRPDMDGTLDSWLVRGPFHPHWSYWLVSVIHLRPIPGGVEPSKKYAEADHEFLIVSLDPRKGEPDLEAVEDGRRGFSALMPPDVATQFNGLTDEQAVQLCEYSVRAILDGRISPDSDFRALWHTTIENTVRHMKGEGHLPPNIGA